MQLSITLQHLYVVPHWKDSFFTLERNFRSFTGYLIELNFLLDRETHSHYIFALFESLLSSFFYTIWIQNQLYSTYVNLRKNNSLCNTFSRLALTCFGCLHFVPLKSVENMKTLLLTFFKIKQSNKVSIISTLTVFSDISQNKKVTLLRPDGDGRGGNSSLVFMLRMTFLCIIFEGQDFLWTFKKKINFGRKKMLTFEDLGARPYFLSLRFIEK